MAEFLLKKESSLDRFDLERGGSLFFYISLGIFVAVLVSLGGLIVLNRGNLNARDGLVHQNQLKEESLRPELLQQVVVLDTRLKNVRTLLGSHPFVSNVFSVLEHATHPQVRFLNFNFTGDSRKVDMSGEAASYRALSRQIGILERDPQVESVEFGGLSANQEKFVSFRISVIFKPTLLSIRP